MKYTTCFMLLGVLLVPLEAQSTAENRTYFRVGGAYSQNDLKAYLGDRAFNPIYEIGYDFNGPTETTGLGIYFSYLAAHGNHIERYKDPGDKDSKGLKQALFGWRFGIDMRFRTPIKGLTPFGGFNVNWYDGIRTDGGAVPSADDYRLHFKIPAGKWPEGQAKLGVRWGVEYRITEQWGVSIDNSISHWLSKSNATGDPGQASMTGNRHYKGVNPVAPTWLSLSVQYRWNAWKD